MAKRSNSDIQLFLGLEVNGGDSIEKGTAGGDLLKQINGIFDKISKHPFTIAVKPEIDTGIVRKQVQEAIDSVAKQKINVELNVNASDKSVASDKKSGAGNSAKQITDTAKDLREATKSVTKVVKDNSAPAKKQTATEVSSIKTNSEGVNTGGDTIVKIDTSKLATETTLRAIKEELSNFGSNTDNSKTTEDEGDKQVSVSALLSEIAKIKPVVDITEPIKLDTSGLALESTLSQIRDIISEPSNTDQSPQEGNASNNDLQAITSSLVSAISEMKPEVAITPDFENKLFELLNNLSSLTDISEALGSINGAIGGVNIDLSPIVTAIDEAVASINSSIESAVMANDNQSIKDAERLYGKLLTREAALLDAYVERDSAKQGTDKYNNANSKIGGRRGSVNNARKEIAEFESDRKNRDVMSMGNVPMLRTLIAQIAGRNAEYISGDKDNAELTEVGGKLDTISASLNEINTGIKSVDNSSIKTSIEQSATMLVNQMSEFQKSVTDGFGGDTFKLKQTLTDSLKDIVVYSEESKSGKGKKRNIKSNKRSERSNAADLYERQVQAYRNYTKNQTSTLNLERGTEAYAKASRAAEEALKEYESLTERINNEKISEKFPEIAKQAQEQIAQLENRYKSAKDITKEGTDAYDILTGVQDRIAAIQSEIARGGAIGDSGSTERMAELNHLFEEEENWKQFILDNNLTSDKKNKAITEKFNTEQKRVYDEYLSSLKSLYEAKINRLITDPDKDREAFDTLEGDIELYTKRVDEAENLIAVREYDNKKAQADADQYSRYVELADVAEKYYNIRRDIAMLDNKAVFGDSVDNERYNTLQEEYNQIQQEYDRLKIFTNGDSKSNPTLFYSFKKYEDMRKREVETEEKRAALLEKINKWTDKNKRAAEHSDFVNRLKEIKELAREENFEGLDKLSSAFSNLTNEASSKGLTGRNPTNLEMASNTASAKSLMQRYKSLIAGAGAGAFKNFGNEIKATQDAIEFAIGNGMPEALKAARQHLTSLTAEFKTAGYAGANIFTTLEKQIRGIGQLFISGGVVGQIKSRFSEAYSSIVNLDTAFANILMTMNATDAQMKALADSSIEMARDVGLSLDEVMNAAQIYANQTIGVQEIMNRARPTALLSSASGMTASASADLIQGAIYQFNMDDTEENLMRIVNVVEAVSATTGVEFKRSIEQISEAIQTSGAIAASSGYNIEQYSALIGALVEKTRKSGSEVANALKMVFSRLGQNLEGDATEEEISRAEKAYAQFGIAIRNSTDDFRDLPEVFDELAQKWDTMTDTEKAYIAEISSGNRNRSMFISMMDSYTTQLVLAEEAYNSLGFAEKANETRLESFAAKLEQFSAAASGFWNHLLDTEGLKLIIDGATALVTHFDNIVQSPLMPFIETLFTVLLVKLFPNLLKELKESESVIGIVLRTASNTIGEIEDFDKVGRPRNLIGILDALTDKIKGVGDAAQETTENINNIGNANPTNNIPTPAQPSQTENEQRTTTTPNGADGVSSFVENAGGIIEATNDLNDAQSEAEDNNNNLIDGLRAQGETMAETAGVIDGLADSTDDNNEATREGTVAAGLSTVAQEAQAASTRESGSAMGADTTLTDANRIATDRDTDSTLRNAGAQMTQSASLGGAIKTFFTTVGSKIASFASTAGGATAIVIGALAAVNAIRSALSDAREDSRNALAEKLEEVSSAASEMKTAMYEIDDAQAEVTELYEKYKKLSEGVDNNGYRISLSAEQYEEYKSVVTDIAALSPALVSAYNAEGLAILDLGKNVDELTQKYRALRVEQAQQYLTENEKNTLEANKGYFDGAFWGAYNTSDAHMLELYKTFAQDLKEGKSFDLLDSPNIWARGMQSFYSPWGDIFVQSDLEKMVAELGHADYEFPVEELSFLNGFAEMFNIGGDNNAALAMAVNLKDVELSEVEAVIAEYEKRTRKTRESINALIESDIMISTGGEYAEWTDAQKSFVDSFLKASLEGDGALYKAISENKEVRQQVTDELIGFTENETLMSSVKGMNELTEAYHNGAISLGEFLEQRSKYYTSGINELGDTDYSSEYAKYFDSEMRDQFIETADRWYSDYKGAATSEQIRNYLKTLNAEEFAIATEMELLPIWDTEDWDKAIEDKLEEKRAVFRENFKFWDSEHDESIDGFITAVNEIGEAYRNVENLTSEELIDLMQKFDTIDWAAYGVTGAQGVGDIRGALRSLAQVELNNLREAFGDVDDEQMQVFKDIINGAMSAAAKVSDLADAIRGITDIRSSKKSIEEEIQKYGRVSADTLASMVEQYPEISSKVAEYMAGLISADELMVSYNKFYQADYQSYIQFIKNKLMLDTRYILEKKKLDEAFYDKIGASEKSFVNYMKDAYGVDLSNCKNYAEAKVKIFSKLVELNREIFWYFDDKDAMVEKFLNKETGALDFKLMRDYGLSVQQMYEMQKVAAEYNKQLNEFSILIGDVDLSGLEDFNWEDPADELSAFNDALGEMLNLYDQIYDAIQAVGDKRIEALEAEKDALQDKNDEEQREIDLIKAREQLEAARRNKVIREYHEGRGFIWATDAKAIEEAEQAVKDAELAIREAEIDAEIEAVEKYVESATSIIDDINDNKNIGVALNVLGLEEASDLLTLSEEQIESMGDNYEALVLANDKLSNADTVSEIQKLTDEQILQRFGTNFGLSTQNLIDSLQGMYYIPDAIKEFISTEKAVANSVTATASQKDSDSSPAPSKYIHIENLTVAYDGSGGFEEILNEAMRLAAVD